MFAVMVTRPHPGPVLRLTGELDLSTAPILDEAIRQALVGHCEELVVDVGALDFIDARGLGTIVNGHHLAMSRGVPLVLRDPSPLAAMMIEVTGISQVLRIERRPLPTA